MSALGFKPPRMRVESRTMGMFRTLALLAAAGCMIGLPACGSDDGDERSGASATTSETEPSRGFERGEAGLDLEPGEYSGRLERSDGRDSREPRPGVFVKVPETQKGDRVEVRFDSTDGDGRFGKPCNVFDASYELRADCFERGERWSVTGRPAGRSTLRVVATQDSGKRSERTGYLNRR